MDEIKFGPEDVGKWVYSLRKKEWLKITYIDKKDEDLPVRLSDGNWHGKDEVLPTNHPAVLAGKLEIPIPPPPKKKVVLEPGRYYLSQLGRVIRTERPVGSFDIFDGIELEVFEITEPITLVEGEE